MKTSKEKLEDFLLNNSSFYDYNDIPAIECGFVVGWKAALKEIKSLLDSCDVMYYDQLFEIYNYIEEELGEN